MEQKLESKINNFRAKFPLTTFRLQIVGSPKEEVSLIRATVVDNDNEISLVEIPFTQDEYKSVEAYERTSALAISRCIDLVGSDYQPPTKPKENDSVSTEVKTPEKQEIKEEVKQEVEEDVDSQLSFDKMGINPEEEPTNLEAEDTTEENVEDGDVFEDSEEDDDAPVENMKDFFNNTAQVIGKIKDETNPVINFEETGNEYFYDLLQEPFASAFKYEINYRNYKNKPLYEVDGENPRFIEWLAELNINDSPKYKNLEEAHEMAKIIMNFKAKQESIINES